MTEGIDEEASKGCRRGVGVVRARVHGGPVDGEEKKDLSRDYRPIYIGKTYRIAWENSGASANSLGPTVGVRFSGASNNL
jgi:hypothetical protein